MDAVRIWIAKNPNMKTKPNDFPNVSIRFVPTFRDESGTECYRHPDTGETLKCGWSKVKLTAIGQRLFTTFLDKSAVSGLVREFNAGRILRVVRWEKDAWIEWADGSAEKITFAAADALLDVLSPDRTHKLMSIQQLPGP